MTALRFSTSDLPDRDRVPLFQDIVSRRFINTEMLVNPRYPKPFHFDMAMAAGTGLRIAEVSFAAVDVRRGPAHLRDGDDGLTCFLPRGTPVRTDHAGRRGVIASGGAVFVIHGKPGASWWPDNAVTLLQLPRRVFVDPGAIDRAAGFVHAPGRPLLKLLRAYLRSTWQEAGTTGLVPEAAERNLVALVEGLAAHTVDGMARAAWPALGPARVAAMREVIARRAAEPRLDMRAVAAAVGLSERSGHLVLAAGGLTFTACLAAARLDRVQARLEAGDPGRIIEIALDAGFGDVAHFNRLFRARFGMTPTEMRAMATRPG